LKYNLTQATSHQFWNWCQHGVISAWLQQQQKMNNEREPLTMKGKTSPEERMNAMAFLQERYPNAFRVPGETNPLEVGIKGKLIAELKDTLPEGVSMRAIYVALHYYCCTKEYKKLRKIVGTPRINLAGEITGQVTEADLELGRQHDAKKQQAKEEKLARERALEAKRLEKQAQLEMTAAKKAEKEATGKAVTEKPVRKPAHANYKTSGVPPVKASFRPVKAPSQATIKPTITVRKRKTLSLPSQDKKAEEE
jgi:sRNA-binding protein